MGSLSRAYDALIDAAISLDKSVQQAPHEKFDNALRAYVLECQATLRSSVGDALLQLSDEAQDANAHMRAVIRLVDELLYSILRGETK